MLHQILTFMLTQGADGSLTDPVLQCETIKNLGLWLGPVKEQENCV